MSKERGRDILSGPPHQSAALAYGVLCEEWWEERSDAVSDGRVHAMRRQCVLGEGKALRRGKRYPRLHKDLAITLSRLKLVKVVAQAAG